MTRTTDILQSKQVLNRRKLLKTFPAALPLVATGSVFFLAACEGAQSSPKTQGFFREKTPPQPQGIFKETTLRPPMRANAYKGDYKAPIGRFKIQRISFGGAMRKVHVYRPKGTQRKPKSVLLLLHGSNRNGASLLDKWRALSERHNILLIAPDSLRPKHWSLENDPMEFMQAAINDISAKYGFEDAPLYGFGHSAGAIMMTLLAMQHGERFKRIAVHAGYISPQYAAQSERFKTRKPPLAHFLGTKDHIFNVETARQSAETLSQHGQDTRLITFKGHTHWYYSLAPFINKEAWKFLSERPPEAIN